MSGRGQSEADKAGARADADMHCFAYCFWHAGDDLAGEVPDGTVWDVTDNLSCCLQACRCRPATCIICNHPQVKRMDGNFFVLLVAGD